MDECWVPADHSDRYIFLGAGDVRVRFRSPSRRWTRLHVLATQWATNDPSRPSASQVRDFVRNEALENSNLHSTQYWFYHVPEKDAKVWRPGNQNGRQLKNPCVCPDRAVLEHKQAPRESYECRTNSTVPYTHEPRCIS